MSACQEVSCKKELGQVVPSLLRSLFKVVVFLFFVFVGKESLASHVVGGALTYVHNGGSNYTVTLKLYRDCAGVNLGTTATITVVGYNGLTFTPSRDITLTRISVTSLDPDLDSCAIAPNPLPCVEEHIYTATVNNLPANAGGYHLYYQTTARNQFVTNVNTSCNCIGESFYAYIPGTSVLWNENFTLPNGTTSDAGTTAWTRSLGTPAPGYARVESNRFEISGADNAQATWTSQLIDISAYPSGVNIAVDLMENSNMEFTDSLLAYYSLDGGPFTLFPTNGIATDDFTAQLATATGLTGSTLQIMIRAKYGGSSNGEIFRFDNVIVSGNDFATNGNPVFTEFPPLFLCANQPFLFDHSATDPDGDSLVYSFYTPYNGYTGGSPGTPVAPTFSNNVATFTPVIFKSGYSATNPLGGTPLTLDPATGQLSGTPSANGQYLVGIKVSEYRNGVLLGEMVRDFQFNVVTCQPPAEAQITPSGVLTSCNTATVTFPNNSSISASNFWWNFGVTSTLADTSNQQYPTYTYTNVGTYTVTLITNKGLTCADTSTATLYVGWVAAAFNAPASACINTVVNFTNTSTVSGNATITGYQWNFGDGNTSTAVSPSHTYTTAGTYNVSLKATNSIGCDSTIIKTITINSKPTVNAGVDTAICASNVNVPLNGSFTNSSGVTWSGGSGTYSPNNTTATAIYTPSAAEITAGTVTLTLTTAANGACSAAVDTKQITITPVITVEAGNNQVICKGTSATLAGSVTGGTNTGIWTTSGTGTFAPNATTLNAIYTPSNADQTAGGVKLYLTSTNNVGCAAKKDSVLISFFDYPIVDAGTNQQICAGSNLLLSGSVTGSSTTGIWSTTGTGTFSPNATTLNATYIPSAADRTAGSVVLRLTATNSCSPIPFEDITVTIQPTPSVTSGNTATICSSATTNIGLTANIPSTFSWTIGTNNGGITGASAGSGNTISQQLVNPSNSTQGNIQYIVTPASTGSLGCQGSPYPIVVTVNPTPSIAGVPSAASICNNTSTNIALSSTAPSTYSWTIGAVTGSITGQAAGSGNTIAQTLINPSNATAGTVEYLITATSTTGSCPSSAPYSIIVTVNPTPSITGVPATASICNNTSTNIALSSTAPSTYSWTIGAVTGAITGQAAGSGNTIAQTLINPSNATAGTVEYLITATSTTGSCASSAPYSVVVTVNPTPQISGVPATASICNNTATNIALSSTAPSTYSWTIGAVTGGITGQAAGSGNTIAQTLTNPSNATAGTVEYLITATSTTGSCASSAPYSVVVTVNPTPSITTGSTKTICNNTSTGINLTSSTSSSFTWGVGNIIGGVTGANNGSGNNINQVLINPSNATAGTVEYIVVPSSVAGSCDGSPYTITVTVDPTPVVTSTASATICNNTAQNYLLTSSVSNATYTWSRVAVAGISNPAISNQSANPITEVLVNTTNVPVNVIYTITPSANGCSNPTPFDYTLTVYPTATISSIAADVICNNTAQNYTITSNVAGVSYAWDRNVITGISNPAVSNQTANPITETLVNTTNAPINVVYNITATANGCTNPAIFNYTVRVNPTPTITSTASAAICSGSATNYTITSSVGGTTYAWGRGAVTGISNSAVSAQTTNPINETLTNTTNAPVDVTYVITPIANGCAGPAFNYVVTVDPTPIVNSVATGVVCSGVAQNYLITGAVAGSAFRWTRAVVPGISNPAVNNQTANPITETLVNTTNVPVNVKYVIIPSANTCAAGVIFEYIVTVNPISQITSSGAGVICNNTAQNYQVASSVSGTTYTWSRGIVAGISNPAVTNQTSSAITETLSNTTNAPVAVTYVITPSANGCANPQPFNYTVTVNPTAQVTSAASGIVCSGIAQNYSLIGSVTGTTYNWTRAAVAGITNAAATGTSSSITETLINTTNQPVDVTYSITPSANGCANPSVFIYTVTVNPTPLVNSAAAGTICSGVAENYNITASVTGTTFTWTRGSVAGISNAAVSNQTSNPIVETLINTSNAQVNVPYTIIPVANGCTGPAFNYTVIVNPTPTMSSATAGIVCSEVPQNYLITSPVTGTTYTWSRAAVTGISNTAVNNQAANPITETLVNTTTNPVNVTYVITLSANGCTNPTSYNYVVTVNPRPTVTSTANGIVCSGAAQNYTFTSGVAGTTYSWTRAAVSGISNPAGNGTSTGITESLNNTTNAPVDVTYNITPTANGCINPVPFAYKVTVNPTPNVTSANTGIVCSSIADSYTITGGVSGSSFAWSRASVAGISNPAVTNQVSNTIAETLVNTTSNTINVNYQIVPSANGCTGPAFTYSKSVKPTPLTPVVNNNGPLCVGANLLLSTNTVPGATYNWTGPNGFATTQQNPSIANVSFADNGIYSVTSTLNGCTSPAGTTNVNISNSPSTANAGTDEIICAGNTLNLYGTITGGSSSGVWSTSGSGSFAPSNTFLTSTYTPSNADTAAGSVTLTLTSTNNGACPASSHSIVVTINDAATANAGADQSICAYKTVSLNGNVTVATGGLWTSSGTGTFQPSPTTLNAVYVPSTADIAKGNVDLTLTTTGTGSCKVVNDKMAVTIIPAPTVNVGEDKIILLGQSVTLQPSVGGTSLSFQWTPNVWIAGTTQPNTIVTPQDDATYILTVTGQGGCIAKDSVKITVLFPPQIPNVFSPNGDGINDRWEVPHLAKYPGCTVQIFTRYGQQIYYSEGYDQPWDGTHKGKAMPVGTYYYVIEPKNGVPRFSGYVVLLR